MGIPRFFKWIATSDGFNCVQNLYYQEKFPANNLECFYIDSNSIIHSCITEEYFPEKPRLVPRKKAQTKEEKELSSFKKITKFIEHLIEFVKPSKMVYITIDGSAPLAKQTQQRQRRTKAATDINKKKIFDRCQITPGTEFLYRLKEYMKKWCSKYSKINNIKIYFSSQNVVGEGEHKIIDYIRDHPTKNGICMYGIDADLFMLALSTHIYPFYLIREDPSTKETNRYYYTVDIRLFAEQLFKKYAPNCNMKNFINDFIFLSMFVGNDFIPHLPGFYDLETVLPLILETRKKLNDNYIIENNNINWNNLKIFLSKLNKYAIKLISALSIDSNNVFQDKIVNTCTKTGLFDFKKYKKLYYKNAYNSATIDFVDSNKICEEYLIALDWVYKYYISIPKNWQYQYPFHYAPFLGDLVKWLDNNIPEIVSDKICKPLSPFEQLLCVIPKTSFDLLPKSLQNIPKKLEKFYPDPNSIKIDTNGIMSEHEALVLLPIIDIKLIISFYNKNKTNFTDNEIKLNTKDKVLIFK